MGVAFDCIQTNKKSCADCWSNQHSPIQDSLVEKADSAISKYGWKAVFESWKTYMYENCHTVEEALSFAAWFEIYGGHNHRIEEPYKFLAYLYDIFDLNPVKYNAQIIPL